MGAFGVSSGRKAGFISLANFPGKGEMSHSEVQMPKTRQIRTQGQLATDSDLSGFCGNPLLKITDLDSFAHLLQAGGKLLDQVHFDAEIDGEPWILVGGVDRSAHKEVDIRCLLEQQAGNLGRTVSLKIPLLIAEVVPQVVLGIGQNLVDRDNPLRDQIHRFQLGDGRHILCNIIQGGDQRLSEIFCSNRGGCPAADDVLALLGEKQTHHAVAVILVGRRAEQDVHEIGRASCRERV